MDASPAFTQNALRDGVVEFAFGEPDPALLPVGLVLEACGAALGAEGAAALAYGSNEGPEALRAAIAARITAREGRPTEVDDVLVTAGNSLAIDQVLTLLTAPGDTVLVESPTYNLALGIVADHPVEVVGVPLDGDGLDVEALERTLGALAAAGKRARLLYTIPTYHNPTGVCLAPARRARLLELARAHDLVVVEDDVYRELGYDGDAPPALWALDDAAPVVRLGSFSKSLAPGLRLGWITARPDLLERLAASGVLESGGCVAQLAAHVTAGLLAGGHYDEHVETLRRAYAARRDALAESLAAYLPAGCRFAVPAGGFFVWVELPAGLTATALLPVAEAAGAAFAPGRRFCSDGDDRGLRLAFSLYAEDALAEGGRRLGSAIAEATAEL